MISEASLDFRVWKINKAQVKVYYANEFTRATDTLQTY